MMGRATFVVNSNPTEPSWNDQSKGRGLRIEV